MRRADREIEDPEELLRIIEKGDVVLAVSCLRDNRQGRIVFSGKRS
jgi:hypothetical protein